MRKAAFHTLGCKVNSWETEAMEQLLEADGYEIVPFTEKADVYVINTCSVTNVADRKSRQMLHRAKKMNPDAVVVAAGCYVQSAEGALKQDDAVDLIVGNDRKTELARLLNEYLEERGAGKREKKEDVLDMNEVHEFEDLHISRTEEHTRAFIKVQDGCNQFCSYCIIPYTRGRIRSRRPGDVVREVTRLAASGYKEFVLTGIHLASYGKDFKDAMEGAGDSNMNLLDLIVMLDRVPGVERIRLGSLEPRVVTREFAQTIATLRTICPHFHLSLQSGCDATLERMNRHYTAKEYLYSCDELREAFDHPAITTDVIVGFPGETEEEFEESRRFLEKVNFYEMHVFRYSRRKGTRADRMDHQIPEAEKEKRSDILIRMGDEMSKEFRRWYLGKETEVLLEEPVEIDGVKYMMGHTREYVKGAVPYRDGMKNVTVRGTFTRMLNDEVLLLE
ncbi:tRNA (N(6)-L-threonylcarbamoyladenosine(37)-C(2))-methylthiotransferase MtaB [[Clostridium] aminophilum]|uniref:tRNA (N(6)-L-threonylcarbamoyladenosine(37)-C(2))- methylthiotransferase MtaB n=1 Tax=[Clostridium] aminophilum TaxID=1526 RepID=UPI003F9CF691